jgi:hypothetical protein
VLVRRDHVMEGMVQGCIEMNVKVTENPRGFESLEGNR